VFAGRHSDLLHAARPSHGFAFSYIKDAESSSVERAGPSLAIEWKVFGSRFEGKIAEDLSAI